jgi:ATP/maltotriose-dependent transcriptional regulator MalT
MTDEGARNTDRPTVLLESKFHAPMLRSMHVSRPRLLARLDVERPLTLVEAPVGFGTSTLPATNPSNSSFVGCHPRCDW